MSSDHGSEFQSKNPFQVGDLVRLVDASATHMHQGEDLRVTGVHPRYIMVENRPGGWNHERFELVSRPNPFRVGDRIVRTVDAPFSIDWKGFMRAGSVHVVDEVISNSNIRVVGNGDLWDPSKFVLQENYHLAEKVEDLKEYASRDAEATLDVFAQQGVKSDDGKDPWHLLPKCAYELLVPRIEESDFDIEYLLMKGRKMSSSIVLMDAAKQLVNVEVASTETRIEFLHEVVLVLAYGAKKYSPDNWKRVPNLQERYFAAAMRHLYAAQKDAGAKDPETGLLHVTHALCCVLFMIEDLQEKEQARRDEEQARMKAASKPA